MTEKKFVSGESIPSLSVFLLISLLVVVCLTLCSIYFWGCSSIDTEGGYEGYLPSMVELRNLVVFMVILGLLVFFTYLGCRGGSSE